MYAYNLSTKAHDSGKDFTLDADNTGPEGLWSDGTTMWITDASDTDDDTDDFRDASRDLDTLDADNSAPEGAWSDGTTMWIVDANNDKIYAYGLPTVVDDDAPVTVE